MLDDELAIEAGGEVNGGGKLASMVDLGDADRGAEVRGLDEDRVGERLLDEAGAAFGVGAPCAAQEDEMRRLLQTGGGEETLHGVLVHGGGGAEHAGADVGDVGEFEEALNGAILAEGAVEHGKDDVQRGGERVARLCEFGVCDVLKRICCAPLRVRRGNVERLSAAQNGSGDGKLSLFFAEGFGRKR